MHPLTLIHKINARLRARGHAAGGESGYVLIISMLMLFVMTSAIGAMASASINLSNQGTRQAASARAAATADAGAQAALFALNTAGTTTGVTGSMGNGASYTYTIAALTQSTSSSCAGLWAQNSSITLSQDCITSTGTVDGVHERVQERVIGEAAAASLYPVNGVFAIHGLSTNEIGGTFSLGSNGALSLSNASLGSITGSIEYLAGNFSQSQNSGQMCTGTCTTQVLASAITVPAVADSVYAAAATTNNNLTGITYTNASYSANVLTGTNNNAVVTFAPGTYYFCGINVGGFSNFAINTSGAGIVQIYVDSQYRSGSTCTQSGNGQISNAGNSTAAINGSGVSSNLQMFFYGQPTCTTSCPAAITPMNAATINADVFAPYSSMTSGGAFVMHGALVIGQFTANNNFTFTYQTPTNGGGGSGSASTFYPSAHQECIASTTVGGTSGPC